MKKNSKTFKHKKSSKTKLQPSKKQRSLQKTGDLRPSVLISGYYGFENLGDELILKVLVDELKARQVKITVLSQNPQKTAADYGVKAIKRSSFIDVVDALASTNLFISGGGGLFQDATGPMSTVYYGGLIHLARFFDVPVVFWAQGVGPLKRQFSRSMTASALKKCEKITVRDEKSAALVESLMGEKPEITADPVWLLKLAKRKPPKTREETKKIGKSAEGSSLVAKMPWCVGISLRPWPDLTADKLEALADCLNALAQQREGAVQFKLLPFQKKEDTQLLAGFAKRLKSNHRITVEMVEPMAVLEAVGTCNVLLGMRFHSLILGLLYGVPVYGLTYDPKVASLLEMFNLKGTSIASLKTISPDGLHAAFEDYPEIDLKPFLKQSRKNLRVLEQLLEIPESKLVL
jgi:polysaccharide pyruvyl transferase CsaB